MKLSLSLGLGAERAWAERPLITDGLVRHWDLTLGLNDQLDEATSSRSLQSGSIDGADTNDPAMGSTGAVLTTDDFLIARENTVARVFTDASSPFTLQVLARPASNATGSLFARAGATLNQRMLDANFFGGQLNMNVRGVTSGNTNILWADGAWHLFTVRAFMTFWLLDYDRTALWMLNVGSAAEEAGQYLTFGARENGTAQQISSASIALVLLYSRAFTAAESQANYDAIKNNFRPKGISLL